MTIDLKKDLSAAELALNELVPPTSKEQVPKREGKASCSGDPRMSTPADQPNGELGKTKPDRAK